MPLDSITVGALARELDNCLSHARIDKIYQPARFCFSFSVRTQHGNHKLIMSCSDSPYAYISPMKRDNPEVSPMLCMLLRKHLTGARIINVEQPELERILVFNLECTNEIGEKIERKLILELMGKHSNLILTDSEGRITECARHVDYEASSLRQVLPGLFYRLPPAPRASGTLGGENKSKITLVQSSQILSLAKAEISAYKARGGNLQNDKIQAYKWLLDNFFGLSPIICREAAFRASGDTQISLFDMSESQLLSFCQFAAETANAICCGEPYLLIKNGQTDPFDFSFMPILQYPDSRSEKCKSFCEMLSRFYDNREINAKISEKKREISKTADRIKSRLERKLDKQTQELCLARDRDKLLRFADLLMANLHAVKSGQEYAEVIDLFDEAQPVVKIPLDKTIPPYRNAQKFYKEYSKKKNAEIFLTQEIQRTEKELAYIKSVADAIDRCDQAEVALEIRDELCAGGYIRQTDKRKKVKLPVFCPREYKTDDGFLIKVGRSNRENDRLSLKTARPFDLWFHVKNESGAHVILICRDGEPPSESAINAAAAIAAYHSSAHGASGTAVDYTQARFVKKLHGGAPGAVNYSNYKTIYALCNEQDILKMRELAADNEIK